MAVDRDAGGRYLSGRTMSEDVRQKISTTTKGRPKSAETRQRMSEAARRRSQEHRQKLADVLRGQWNGHPATGSYYQDGYRYLTGQQDHPLASSSDCVAEHRVVLYEKIGPGPHPCHWCGGLLGWGGKSGINVDHLDNDKLNNDPDNLVPSCGNCNRQRGLMRWRP